MKNTKTIASFSVENPTKEVITIHKLVALRHHIDSMGIERKKGSIRFEDNTGWTAIDLKSGKFELVDRERDRGIWRRV
ncbi:hypothetical protein [Janthinobacterium violaceinigrum]|uniref:Uncharacterized protein n=1 Tax=Janthinobacterium violaceinigrum TaxID=2654252 RepID=A0A6I1ID37_9BURK|nr:hypothetical protein [Janthinobacterium violaceinigrum]KAB8066256.1 hypothetical protein GCN75_03420 [Janthinobacterium violaceinigrum]